MVLVKSHPMAIKSPKIIKAVSLENERPLQKCHNNLGQLTVNKGFKSSQNCKNRPNWSHWMRWRGGGLKRKKKYFYFGLKNANAKESKKERERKRKKSVLKLGK